jgi:hypothetical protein
MFPVSGWIIWILVWWILHLEFTPGMGGIWIRPNAAGIRVFTYKNLLSFALIPFQQTWIWRPEFWDLNIIIMLCLGVALSQAWTWWTTNGLEWIYQHV